MDYVTCCFFLRVLLPLTRLSPHPSLTPAGFLSAVYVAGLLVCLMVGVTRGPKVFERSGTDEVKADTLDTTWYGQISGMEPWHQVGARCTRYSLSSTLPRPSRRLARA